MFELLLKGFSLSLFPFIGFLTLILLINYKIIKKQHTSNHIQLKCPHGYNICSFIEIDLSKIKNNKLDLESLKVLVAQLEQKNLKSEKVIQLIRNIGHEGHSLTVPCRICCIFSALDKNLL